MGQQQILLIVLSVILVGIAVSVGLTMFRGYSESAAQDAIILDIMNISTLAYQYRLRPSMMGGGNGSYGGFTLPADFASNSNGVYSALPDETGQFIQIVGTSNVYSGATITARYDLNLNLVAPAPGGGVGSGGNGATAGYFKNGWGD